MSRPVEGINVAVLHGTLSSTPRARLLPSGDELLALEVTIPHDDGPDETVPVAWFPPRNTPELERGDAVVVTGRVRRRFFRAGDAVRSATEVVADSVVRASHRARVRRAIDQAVAALDTAGTG
jgi:single-strand DNA-binding protein